MTGPEFTGPEWKMFNRNFIEVAGPKELATDVLESFRARFPGDYDCSILVMGDEDRVLFGYDGYSKYLARRRQADHNVVEPEQCKNWSKNFEKRYLRRFNAAVEANDGKVLKGHSCFGSIDCSEAPGLISVIGPEWIMALFSPEVAEELATDVLESFRAQFPGDYDCSVVVWCGDEAVGSADYKQNP